MHIVYLHQYFATPSMPDGTRSYEMARRLVAAGHRVTMVTSFRHPTERRGWYVTNEDGIEVHWLPVPYSNRMSYARRILAFLQFAVRGALRAASIRGDVVFATSTPLTIALPGAYAAWRSRVPMVFEVRDMWPDVPIAMGILRNPLLVRAARELERAAYRWSAHIVALAPGMRDDIVAKGVSPERITVIPNGCDNSVFGQEPDPAKSPRTAHSWLGGRKMVIYPGAVGRVNGVQYLVDVAAHCRALDPEIRFVIIGAGAEWEDVRARAERAGVLDASLFMLPAMAKNDLAHWVVAADLLACLIGPKSVSKDAVQNKFFDAMAAGIPTASNFEGFQTHIAAEHDIGLVLDPEDPAAGAATLVRALRDDAWLDGVRRRSRALAHGRFSRDHLAAELRRVLEDTVARQGALNGGAAAGAAR
jgi:glycosyltransferase involved in cell wall biosynthesis